MLSNCQQVQLQERPLGRPRRRWEDTIRMDLKEIGINLLIPKELLMNRMTCRSICVELHGTQQAT